MRGNRRPAPPSLAPRTRSRGLHDENPIQLDATPKKGSAVTVAFTTTDASAPGTLNDASNPVDWTQLKGVPAGFSDGIDADGGAWTTSGDDVFRAGGRVGLGTASPAADLHVVGLDGALLGGTYGAGAIPAEGAGARMMWYPRKAAFRVGAVDGAQWDDASVGLISTAMGWNSIASGEHSVALGAESSATGQSSVATGHSTLASGPYTTAMGYFAVASGYNAFSIGDFTTASNNSSVAMGAGTVASGVHSVSMGTNTVAQAVAALAVGRFNVAAGSSGAVVSTDPVLIVGNGTSVGARSNAFTLLRNGNLTIAGTLTQNSDLRLKRDVVALTDVLSRIGGLRGVSYEFKDTDRSPEGRQIGLVAQEVREAFPELVREDSQGSLSVSYQNFTAVLLEAVKEQQASIEAKDKEIAAIKRELAATKASMEERLATIEEQLRR